MEGLIIKIISNQCFVKNNKEVIVCSFRGNMRRQTMLPLVGDKVLFDKEKRVVEEILPRRNSIRRPPVANITQAIIVTSLVCPDFSTNLIDKLLIELEFNNIKPYICLTKKDLISNEEYKKVEEDIKYYNKIGYKVFNNNVDLPDPETPVKAINLPSGKSTFTFLIPTSPVSYIPFPNTSLSVVFTSLSKNTIPELEVDGVKNVLKNTLSPSSSVLPSFPMFLEVPLSAVLGYCIIDEFGN